MCCVWLPATYLSFLTSISRILNTSEKERQLCIFLSQWWAKGAGRGVQIAKGMNGHRTVFDAQFVLSLGAEVNNNKRRVSIVFRNPGVG